MPDQPIQNATATNQAAPSTAPEHPMLTRVEAAKMFGVSLKTWTTWDSEGRIQCGVFVNMKGGHGGYRVKLYPVADLVRLKEEFRRLVEPYPDPERPGCYRVPIASNKCHREAIIDAADLPLVQGKRWNWGESDTTHEGNVILSVWNGPQTPMARIILRLNGPQYRITYANGNPLDCRRANLVVLTIEQQCRRNRKMGIISGRKYTSKFKGVSWDSERNKWLVQITKDGKYRYVGRYRDQSQAARAYDMAARTLFGIHAHLNFPQEWEPEKVAA